MIEKYEITDYLKDDKELQKAVIEEFLKENADLKAENARLKEEINKLGKKHEDYCNTMYWQMKEQMDKYRSALQEIKKIAVMDICSNCITQKREDNCQCLADTILQKITKAESEEV